MSDAVISQTPQAFLDRLAEIPGWKRRVLGRDTHPQITLDLNLLPQWREWEREAGNLFGCPMPVHFDAVALEATVNHEALYAAVTAKLLERATIALPELVAMPGWETRFGMPVLPYVCPKDRERVRELAQAVHDYYGCVFGYQTETPRITFSSLEIFNGAQAVRAAER